MRALGPWRVFGFYLLMASLGLVATNTHALFPSPTHAAWRTALIGGLGAGLTLVWLSRLALATIPGVRLLCHEQRNMMGGMTAGEIFTVASLSGLSEELLFRGALQPSLGLGLTTCIFALLHVGPTRRFIPWTVMALGGGAVFGLLFWYTGNVMASCIAHVTVNFLNLRLLATGDDRAALRLAPAGRALPLGSTRF